MSIFDQIIAAVTLATALSSLTFDLAWRKIPNLITLPAILLGLVLHGIHGRGAGLLFSLLGLLIGIGFFFIPYVLGGMGAGDVKLLGAIGALQGPGMVVLVFLYTAFVGGVMIVGMIILRKTSGDGVSLNFRGIWTNLLNLILTRRRLERIVDSLVPKELRGVQIPYGVAIGIGTLLALLVGRPSWL